MSEKPYSVWRSREIPCPDCGGKGGHGDGDDFEICWCCDDGKVTVETEIKLTADEYAAYKGDELTRHLLYLRYKTASPLSIADYWQEVTARPW
jgi:hypothetical protein